MSKVVQKRHVSSDVPYDTLRILDLAGYLQLIKEVGYDGDCIFRGQRCDWPLLPSIERIKKQLLGYGLFDKEQQMFLDFKHAAVAHLKIIPNNDWDWLAVAQHHGLPTRLLDWTTSALAALWFCVCKPGKKNSDGVVWVWQDLDQEETLRATALDRIQNSPLETKKLMTFFPAHCSPRISSQSGLFSLHPQDSANKRLLSVQEAIQVQGHFSRLIKIMVPWYRFCVIRQELYVCGIHSASLFPDLEGLAAAITCRHSNSEDVHAEYDCKKSVLGKAKL